MGRYPHTKGAQMIRRCIITAVLAAALIGTTAVPASAAPSPSSAQVQVWAPSELEALLALDTADLARPDGWWGWTQCVGAVAVWGASNAFAAAKVASMVKRFGSIRAAIAKAQALIRLASPSKKRWAIVAALGAIGTEIAGVGSIVDSCFQ